MNYIIIDDFLDDPNKYVKEVLQGKFEDIADGDTLFKGIQPRLNINDFCTSIGFTKQFLSWLNHWLSWLYI